jgi:AcrR family transcriptional regulator
MKEKNTEQLILNAAKKIFIEKGKDGAKMQEIADEAGINKALLHYYFRSKDKLFTVIITEALHNFLPNLEKIFCANIYFEEKIKLSVDSYITLLSENPFIPPFILHELNRNPDEILQLILSSGIQFNLILDAIQKDLNSNLSKIDVRHFIANLLSLCIFPIASRHLLLKILFNNDKKAYDNFIEERKTLVAEFIIKTLKV